ncbi:YjfB family protein [Clostridium sp. JS66]|uniref:YjfB family protein n=1 Tax=Clostridium sp. JS66 TaxID=3064705 RepID=UPI00298E9DD1|nr:YjfB family protein [Clostridium sp. JS66]WPC41018.1 YjfB family protein [Clostridium sp. JS66]
MDIASLSTVMSQSKAMEQASISVMKIAMNTSQENLQGVTDMIEEAAIPDLGQNLDIRG